MKYDFKPKLQYDTSSNDAALIAGSSQVASSAIGAMAQSSLNSATRAWDEKMYRQQRADALADVASQEAYNAPSAQMARFKAAGLNPNLIYGNAQGTTAPPIRSSSVPQWSPKAPDYSGIAQGVGNALSVKLQQAQLNNAEAQNAVILAQAGNISASTDKIKAETPGATAESGISQFNLSYKTEMHDIMQATDLASLQQKLTSAYVDQDANKRANQMQAGNLQNQAIQILRGQIGVSKDAAETANLQARLKGIQADSTIKAYEAMLTKFGIEPGDPLWARAAAILASGTGPNSNGIINNPKLKKQFPANPESIYGEPPSDPNDPSN